MESLWRRQLDDNHHHRHLVQYHLRHLQEEVVVRDVVSLTTQSELLRVLWTLIVVLEWLPTHTLLGSTEVVRWFLWIMKVSVDSTQLLVLQGVDEVLREEVQCDKQDLGKPSVPCHAEESIDAKGQRLGALRYPFRWVPGG